MSMNIVRALWITRLNLTYSFHVNVSRRSRQRKDSPIVSSPSTKISPINRMWPFNCFLRPIHLGFSWLRTEYWALMICLPRCHRSLNWIIRWAMHLQVSRASNKGSSSSWSVICPPIVNIWSMNMKSRWKPRSINVGWCRNWRITNGRNKRLSSYFSPLVYQRWISSSVFLRFYFSSAVGEAKDENDNVRSRPNLLRWSIHRWWTTTVNNNRRTRSSRIATGKVPFCRRWDDIHHVTLKKTQGCCSPSVRPTSQTDRHTQTHTHNRLCLLRLRFLCIVSKCAMRLVNRYPFFLFFLFLE